MAAIAAICSTSPSVRAAEILVFAAASLTDALKEIGADHEMRSGVKVVFNFAGSGILARQIEAGAPADIFFSADEARMDALEAKGLMAKETRRSRLSNTLVLGVASHRGAPVRTPADLAGDGVRRVALAETRTVPAGIYARAYLESRNLWPAVEPKVVPADNVRGALAAVESGNVDAAMVYKTDAAISKRVKVVFEVPPAEGPTISYPVAMVRDTRRQEAALGFLRHLDSDDAARVFEKFGFLVIKKMERVP